jgi:NADPH:quinone reductase-like Zn-dependent oxidoreductase
MTSSREYERAGIGRVLPLAQAAHAHELLETRKTEGKLVLSVADSQPLS